MGDDGGRVCLEAAARIAHRKPYEQAYRIVSAGEEYNVRSRAVTLNGPTGALEGWLGITALADGAAAQDLGPALTPELIRGARALLDWTLSDLADASRGSLSSIRRAEATLQRGLHAHTG